MEQVERSQANFGYRAVVPGRKVLVENGPAAVMILPPGARPGAPQIEVVRDGDVIQAIDVTCACGAKIRLRCCYDDAGPGA
jgi:hypothetical protein